MIIKFDHISYVDSRSNKRNIIKGKNFLFKQEAIRNLGIKYPLMKYSQEFHDIYYLNNMIPVEYIFYDKVSDKTDVYLENNIIFAKYCNKQSSIDFLCGIFGEKYKCNGDIIRFEVSGLLDKEHKIFLQLYPIKDAVQSAFLDSQGWGTIALIVNSHFSKIPKDGICTAHEKIIINDKVLDICFTKSDAMNLIFEIIRIEGSIYAHL